MILSWIPGADGRPATWSGRPAGGLTAPVSRVPCTFDPVCVTRGGSDESGAAAPAGRGRTSACQAAERLRSALVGRAPVKRGSRAEHLEPDALDSDPRLGGADPHSGALPARFGRGVATVGRAWAPEASQPGPSATGSRLSVAGPTRRAASPRAYASGRTRPGLRIPSGSNAALIERITRTASSPRWRTSQSRRAVPMPCSPVTLPPISMAVW